MIALLKMNLNQSARKERQTMGEQYYCSFCGKHQNEVVALIAGPVVFICDECVDACVPIVAKKRKEKEDATAGAMPGHA